MDPVCVHSECPNLVMDLQTNAVLSVFEKGFQDAQSVDVRYIFFTTFRLTHVQVRLATLQACVSYLSTSDTTQLMHLLPLCSMLDALPSLPNVCLKTFLSSLTPLCASHSQLFAPHMDALLSFLCALIIPSTDRGPTPTVANFLLPLHRFLSPLGVIANTFNNFNYSSSGATMQMQKMTKKDKSGKQRSSSWLA